jgi:ribosome-binding protein aMBF1 (putative translation factor)
VNRFKVTPGIEITLPSRNSLQIKLILIIFKIMESFLIGDRIGRARRAIGLSLRGLAETIGISRTMVAKYENNQATPSS